MLNIGCHLSPVRWHHCQTAATWSGAGWPQKQAAATGGIKAGSSVGRCSCMHSGSPQECNSAPEFSPARNFLIPLSTLTPFSLYIVLSQHKGLLHSLESATYKNQIVTSQCHSYKRNPLHHIFLIPLSSQRASQGMEYMRCPL